MHKVDSILEDAFVVGAKQTLKLISENGLERVYIALDADSYVTRELIEATERAGIPISYVESRKRLGKQCGIDIGAACAGVRRTETLLKS